MHSQVFKTKFHQWMIMDSLMIIYNDSHTTAINSNIENLKFNLNCFLFWYIDESSIISFIARVSLSCDI